MSGVGIDLDANREDPESMRRAAHLVLGSLRFRAREIMADGFTALDAESAALRLTASLEV
ncbi:hypothetical protein AB4Y38_34760 [Paraburkholderia sp. EG285A]